MKNKKIKKIIFLKGKRKIVSLTSYTFPISKILNRYCDLILVGDSVGTVYYGMKSTREDHPAGDAGHDDCTFQKC